MKKLLFTVFIFSQIAVSGQSLKKYPVAQTGCTVYMFCDPGKFEISYSEDSSEVYAGECIKDGFTHGLICVVLKDSVGINEDAEGLLESYLDFLKSQFKIRDAAGYGKGMHLKDRDDIIGIIDYWQAEDKSQYAIQGWTDGKIIAVLYVNGMEQPDLNKQKIFFNGFRFPGMQ